jgi:ribokinase
MTLFVVGNVTEDLLFRVPRLPSPGETLIALDRLSDIGGKGLNQAVIAARCGMDVHLIASVGADEAGQRARELAAAEPMRATLIEKPGPTDQSIIVVAEGGENHIISSAFAASALTVEDVATAMGEPRPGDVLLVQGNLSQATTLGVCNLARAAGLRVVLNPSPIRWDYAPLWPLVDTTILNAPEACTLSGCNDIERVAQHIADLGVDEFIVTRGADGAVRWQAGNRMAVPARSVAVVDTAGAGDTFCGTYIAARHAGAPPSAALSRAAGAAALTIGRSGTWSAFPSTKELAAILRSTEQEVAT